MMKVLHSAFLTSAKANTWACQEDDLGKSRLSRAAYLRSGGFLHQLP